MNEHILQENSLNRSRNLYRKRTTERVRILDASDRIHFVRTRKYYESNYAQLVLRSRKFN